VKNKQFWVVFTSNNARIVRDPADLPTTEPGFTMLNPDLSRVEGLPPHFWKRVGDEIHPMTVEESIARQRHHDQFGVDNGQGPAGPSAEHLELQRIKAAARAALLGGLVAGFFVGGFWGSVITALILS